MAGPPPITELRSIAQANVELLEEGERLLRASEQVKDPVARKEMVEAAKRLLDIGSRIRQAVSAG
jgi:hypothetical protein